MSKRRHKPRVVVSTPVSAPPAKSRNAVSPGRFNVAGELFDLDGNVLTWEIEDVQPHQVLAEVRAGVAVAFGAGGCGCPANCARY